MTFDKELRVNKRREPFCACRRSLRIVWAVLWTETAQPPDPKVLPYSASREYRRMGIRIWVKSLRNEIGEFRLGCFSSSVQ